jgi:hypothetical protein
MTGGPESPAARRVAKNRLCASAGEKISGSSPPFLVCLTLLAHPQKRGRAFLSAREETHEKPGIPKENHNNE